MILRRRANNTLKDAPSRVMDNLVEGEMIQLTFNYLNQELDATSSPRCSFIAVVEFTHCDAISMRSGLATMRRAYLRD